MTRVAQPSPKTEAPGPAAPTPTEPPAAPEPPTPDAFPLLLGALCATALLVRLALLLLRAPVLEAEGAEYAALARSLLQGEGYIGTLEGGVQLLFPPVFPLLIAAVAWPIGDFETAGRVVSMLSGTALVIPVSLLALRLHGLASARIAGALTALHPLIATSSTAVYSESPYLTLALAGLYFGLRSLELGGLAAPAWAGFLLGLAYLTRTEAFVFLLAVLLLLPVAAVVRRVRLRRLVPPLVTLLGTFTAVSLPYALFLTAQTGTFRVEGKSALNFTMAARMNAGLSYAEASYGLGPDLRPAGPVLNVNQFIRDSSPASRPTVFDLARTLAASAQRNAKPLYDALTRPNSGAPFVLLLAAVGLFAQPWSRERLLGETLLLTAFLLVVAVLLGMNGLLTRYLLPLLPFLVLWTARGIEELARWASGTLAFAAGRVAPSAGGSSATVTRLVLGGAVVAVSAFGAARVPEIGWAAPQPHAVREAGAWLAHHHPGPKRVFDLEPLIAFHSGGTLLCLPYADSALALRYIEQKAPDFVALQGRGIGDRPFMADWLQHGIPSPHARLVHETGTTPEEKVHIYSWRHDR